MLRGQGRVLPSQRGRLSPQPSHFVSQGLGRARVGEGGVSPRRKALQIPGKGRRALTIAPFLSWGKVLADPTHDTTDAPFDTAYTRVTSNRS